MARPFRVKDLPLESVVQFDREEHTGRVQSPFSFYVFLFPRWPRQFPGLH